MKAEKISGKQIKLIVMSFIIIGTVSACFLTCGPNSKINGDNIDLIRKSNDKNPSFLPVREDTLSNLLKHFMNEYGILPPRSQIDTTGDKLVVTFGNFGSPDKLYNNPALLSFSSNDFEISRNGINLTIKFKRVKIDGGWYIETPSDILYSLLRNKLQ